MTMSECMQFPDTWEEFEQLYGFTDKEEVYTMVRPYRRARAEEGKVVA